VLGAPSRLQLLEAGGGFTQQLKHHWPPLDSEQDKAKAAAGLLGEGVGEDGNQASDEDDQNNRQGPPTAAPAQSQIQSDAQETLLDQLKPSQRTRGTGWTSARAG